MSFMRVFLIAVITIMVIGISTMYVNETNHAKENNFIVNADCNALKIYVNAGREGKDHFAFWTMETQETINFKITPEHVDNAQLKYHWECEQEK